MKPSHMDVENIDDYDIQLMTQMENYIEQNYVSPDRSQILHMKRTREIQELDKRFVPSFYPEGDSPTELSQIIHQAAHR